MTNYTPDQIQEIFNAPANLPHPWTKVVSENVQHIAYDDKHQTLYVQFYYKEATYRYYFVPRSVYEEMIRLSNEGGRFTAKDEMKTETNSVGHWFNNHVVNKSVMRTKFEATPSFSKPYVYDRISY
jgi:hypothetical protein